MVIPATDVATSHQRCQEQIAMTAVLCCAGTHGDAFHTLRDAAAMLVSAGHVVHWQHGATPRIEGALNCQYLPHNELARAMREADVVITGASPGLAFQAVRAGARLVCLPRRRHFNEHVDDHQVRFAKWLAEEGYAVVVYSADEALEAVHDMGGAAIDSAYSTQAREELLRREHQFAADVLRTARAVVGRRQHA